MLNKDSFIINPFFKISDHHRIILIGAKRGVGKTSLLNEFKKFYDTLGYYNINYSFDPFCKSEQNNLRKFKDEKVVLYGDQIFDEIDGNFTSRLSKIKSMVHHCLQTSYDKSVHKIFVTCNILDSYIHDQNESFYVISKDLVNFADLVLSVKKNQNNIDSEMMRLLKIEKDRVSNYANVDLRERDGNFFKILAKCYAERFDCSIVPRNNLFWIKYMNRDFATSNVKFFRELFSYYK